MEQLSLIANEPESYLTPKTVKEIQVSAHKRERKLYVLNEEKLPDNIEKEIAEHNLDNTVCLECGTEMEIIGKEVKRRLKIVPAKVSVVEDWYYTYACDDCKKNGTDVPVVKAVEEVPFIKGSYATAEAAAYLMTQKYVMASPLYRLEQEIKEQSVPLLRQTMSTSVTMSIIETAKANGLNLYKYLEWIFKTAPTIASPEDENHNLALLLMPKMLRMSAEQRTADKTNATS